MRRSLLFALALLPACGPTWSSDRGYHCLDIVHVPGGRHGHLEYYKGDRRIAEGELYADLGTEPSSHHDARLAGENGIASTSALGVSLGSTLAALASGYALDEAGRSHESRIVPGALIGVAATSVIVSLATGIERARHLHRALREYNEHVSCQ
jgi:hypothetical protein